MTAVVLGGLLGCAFIGLLVAARRPRARTTPTGARWLPCHSPTCAHLTTIHTPQPGGYTCADCGTTRTETDR